MAKRLSRDDIETYEVDPVQSGSTVTEGDGVKAGLAAAVEQIKANLPKSADLGNEEAPAMIDSQDPRILRGQNDGDDQRFHLAKFGQIPPPMRPTHGTEQLSGAAALKLQEFKSKELSKTNAQLQGTDWEGKVSYIRCTECSGPAIWITGNPFQELTADNWFSSYKAAGSAWPPAVQPYCQCCWLRYKRRVKARVGHLSTPNPGPEQEHTGLVPYARFVETISREHFESLFQEPATAS